MSNVNCDPHTLVSGTQQLFKNDANIFSVLLVVEGGMMSLTVSSEAVSKGTPVVVIDGSGRMADVISYAWRCALL